MSKVQQNNSIRFFTLFTSTDLNILWVYLAVGLQQSINRLLK